MPDSGQIRETPKMTDADTDEIAAAHTAWQEAIADRDEAALDALLADGLTYRHASGRTQDKAEVMKDALARGSSPVLNGIEVRRFGDTGILAGIQPADPSAPGSVEVQLLFVWAKAGDRWQLVARQATMPRVMPA
jgi:ketosteroid isomerase-like protein